MDKKLAILGGEPVVRNKKELRIHISNQAKQEVLDVLEKGNLASFYGGTYVHKYEKTFAQWFEQPYAVAVNSGTSALHIAYLASRLPEFSEVMVPANCYISAVSALIQCNLIPVIVDIDPYSWVMDPKDIRKKLNSNTSAIVAVHMYGQPCPMDEIMHIAREHNLVVIEDCGQSHGAIWNSRKTGTFGDVACFSTCCRKHISMGEGGMVLSKNKYLIDLARAYSHKGKGMGWFDYNYMGYSYNLTEIQAVLGIHAVRNLEKELNQRQKNASVLLRELSNSNLIFPYIPPKTTHAYFKFNCILPKKLAHHRNEIVDAIKHENIGADPSHPYILEIQWLKMKHPTFFKLLDANKQPYYELDTAPVARDVLSRQICLELGPGLNEDDMYLTATAVNKVLSYYLGDKSVEVFG